MAESTIWWIAVGALVAAELLSGSFYLLMLALGMAAGAVAAHAGLSGSLQVVMAAVFGGGAVVLWHLRRPHATATPHAGNNRDVNLDVGETVHVESWQTDGTASVKYRGASWSAVAARSHEPQAAGTHRIVEIRGSQLVIEKI